jgi:uncharacterized protein
MTNFPQDWQRIAGELDEQGWAVVAGLLDQPKCEEIAGLYDRDENFRSKVVMARHGFGRGEYRYFAYPLPPSVAQMRSVLYPPLAIIANGWHQRLGLESRFPRDHANYLIHCHQSGQTRPTPLLLSYGPGDYNCLHQDLYGGEVFPLQVATLLSEPGHDFTGGEFVLTEQRPRMQSRVQVVALKKGDGVIFAVNSRPAKGRRGDHRLTMRHGVSRLHTGRRHVLGLIFHDAV